MATSRSMPTSCARNSRPSPHASQRQPASPRSPRKSPKASSKSRSRTWPTPSSKSRSSAATTCKAMRSTVSAGRAASTPAKWPTRLACALCSCIRLRACCPLTVWAWPICGCCASMQSNGASKKICSPPSPPRSTHLPPKVWPSCAARTWRSKKSRSSAACISNTRVPIPRCRSPMRRLRQCRPTSPKPIASAMASRCRARRSLSSKSRSKRSAMPIRATMRSRFSAMPHRHRRMRTCPCSPTGLLSRPPSIAANASNRACASQGLRSLPTRTPPRSSSRVGRRRSRRRTILCCGAWWRSNARMPPAPRSIL